MLDEKLDNITKVILVYLSCSTNCDIFKVRRK
jgi:hypothetical protein